MTKPRFLMALMFILLCAEAQQSAQAQAPPQTSTNFESSSTLTLQPSQPNGMWDGAVGEGMRQRAMEAEAVIGAGLGIRDGSLYKHNLALSELRFGRIVSRVLGQGCWYQGNFEFLGELFVGSQISPSPRYFVGFAPGIRYEFATGTRWVPFIDGSAGVVGTDIGHPDLGANFEFSLQGGSGVKYHFRDNAAFIFQYRYLHFSNGGLYIHNKGINVNVLLLGASWSF